MAYYRCGPTAIGSRASWSVTSPTDQNTFERPLSGNFDRIFNAFERTNAFEYVRSTFEGGTEVVEERGAGRAEAMVRRVSSSYERADCALAAQTPSAADEDYYREKILYSQARQLFPLQEDLADWINKTIGTTYLTGENFLEALDNGAELCQLAAVIQQRAREALDQGLVVGPVPQLRGRCWQRAARRSFFSRDNADNFLTFCRDLGVHENLLFESDDLVLHNQPRQVVLCLLEVARLATRYRLEPPGLVQLEREIAQEERDSGLDSAMSTAAWQFRDLTPPPHDAQTEETRHKETDQCRSEAEPRPPPRHADSLVLGTFVALVTRLLERGCSCSSARCSRLLKVKKVGEGRYNIAGRNVFIRLLKGRHMMVRVGGGWDTLEHFLSRHDPCQVRLVAPAHMAGAPPPPAPNKKESFVSSTPNKARLKSALTLPIKADLPRARKQSAPSFSTPNTPTNRSTRAPGELRKSLTSNTLLNAPKKSRSMSLGQQKDEKPYGTERVGKAKSRSTTATPAPTPTLGSRKTRSQSLASTPVNEPRRTFSATNGHAKKTRSMSLATTTDFGKPLVKSVSLSTGGAPMTQAAIEESIRLSLAATLVDDSCPKRPFLHIKAKYRSPPPREVPPR
ncbi:PREDICTED: GAS2-like protein 3 [Papilio xuthus]|uniref:GAS2-like protein 3 n=1 Tax=Papilio xuthus TaxID=66420 RepID=A0AAJ6ZFB5_PAPXU|nr:PREDICTED: GAS2-like protein 3 [Papilio xuthus]